MAKLLLSTLESIPGTTITKHLGLVQGSSVRAKHMGRDLMAGLKNMVGGELKGYTEMMDSARRIATGRMEEEAAKLGADAVINVRYTTSAVMESAAEVLAYGTAVKFK